MPLKEGTIRLEMKETVHSHWDETLKTRYVKLRKLYR